MIKVLIVEDHKLTRMGLKTAIQSDVMQVIAETEYGEQAVELAEQLQPDVILMDLGLPNMDGIQATKLIKSTHDNIKIIILTSHNTENEVIEALSAGADAYCMKDINPDKLADVITHVYEGASWIDSTIAKTVFVRLNDLTSRRNPVESPLTGRELEILQLIADGRNNFEIADELGLSQHTIKSHISNVLQKLSVDDRVQAIVRAMREGWVS